MRLKIHNMSRTHRANEPATGGATITTDCGVTVTLAKYIRTVDRVNCPECLARSPIANSIPAHYSIADQFNMLNADGRPPMSRYDAQHGARIAHAAQEAIDALDSLSGLLSASGDHVTADRVRHMAASLERTVQK